MFEVMHNAWPTNRNCSCMNWQYGLCIKCKLIVLTNSPLIIAFDPGPNILLNTLVSEISSLRSIVLVRVHSFWSIGQDKTHQYLCCDLDGSGLTVLPTILHQPSIYFAPTSLCVNWPLSSSNIYNKHWYWNEMSFSKPYPQFWMVEHSSYAPVVTYFVLVYHLLRCSLFPYNV